MRPRRSHVSGPRIAWELKLPLTASSAVSTGVNAPSGLPEPTSFMLSSEPPVTSAVAVMPGNSLAIMVPIPPPVLGAAAFLIAEFLKISYLEGIAMAAIPTVLYYCSILTMVELDAAKYGGGGELLVQKGALWRVTREYWFHFGSLVSIIALMLLGFSPFWPSSGRPCWRSPSATCGAIGACALQARARAGRRYHRRA
jgi:Tripartite ATP-independent periplasmic transporter, DctM component